MKKLPDIAPPPKQSKAQKVFKYLLYSATLLVLFTSSLLFYWNIQPSEVLKVNNNPFPVRPDVNEPSGVEIMTVSYCKVRPIKGEVVARLVGNESIIRLPWGVEDQDTGCIDTDVPIIIPDYATDDKYHFEFDIMYKINPIKTETVNLKSQSFVVKGK